MRRVGRVNVQNILHEIIKELIKILHNKRKSEETSAIRDTWPLGLRNTIRSGGRVRLCRPLKHCTSNEVESH